jgi:hypothetical protein
MMTDFLSAPAQGIIAQIRILGGSIGIAASTAILGTKIRGELSAMLSPGQLSSFQGGSASLTPDQLAAVRRAYADAFQENMGVAAAVSGLATLLTLMAYRRNRLTLDERRKEQIREEIERHRASGAVALRRPSQ